MIDRMRASENDSIQIPTEMLQRAQQLAKQENRTVSELMCDAYREYERKHLWDQLNRYGREQAAALGVTEESLPDVIKEWRKERAQQKNHD